MPIGSIARIVTWPSRLMIIMRDSAPNATQQILGQRFTSIIKGIQIVKSATKRPDLKITFLDSALNVILTQAGN